MLQTSCIDCESVWYRNRWSRCSLLKSLDFLRHRENLGDFLSGRARCATACQGGEVEMKSCFQSSDKQGESGGNRGKGGQVCRRGGGTSSTLPPPLPPPLSQSYLLSHLNPPNISHSWLTLIHLRKLECLLAGNSNQLIIVRSLTEGATATAHMDRGGRCRQRALAIYTRPGFFLFNLFSSPLPLLAPIFLSTALRSCSLPVSLKIVKFCFDDHPVWQKRENSWFD